MPEQRQIIAPTSITDWIYLESVRDLRTRVERVNVETRYELIGIAGLLRRLLFEKHNLAHSAARGSGIKLTFPVNEYPRHARDFTVSPGGDWMPVLSTSGPALYAPGGARVSLARFQNACVGEVFGEPLKLGDFVRHYAHVEGGVHAGRPESELENVLLTQATWSFTTSTSFLRTLAWIGQVALDGLSELTEMVESRWREPQEGAVVDGITAVVWVANSDSTPQPSADVLATLRTYTEQLPLPAPPNDESAAPSRG